MYGFDVKLKIRFGYYIVDQIFGWFKQIICLLQPYMVCLDAIWLNQKIL